MNRSHKAKKCRDCGRKVEGSARCSRCAHRHRLEKLLGTRKMDAEQTRIIKLVLECGTYEAAARREGISRQRIEQIVHTERLLQRQRSRYHQHRARGICVRCLRPAAAGRVHCSKCSAEKRRRYRTEKKQGKR